MITSIISTDISIVFVGRISPYPTVDIETAAQYKHARYFYWIELSPRPPSSIHDDLPKSFEILAETAKKHPTICSRKAISSNEIIMLLISLVILTVSIHFSIYLAFLNIFIILTTLSILKTLDILINFKNFEVFPCAEDYYPPISWIRVIGIIETTSMTNHPFRYCTAIYFLSLTNSPFSVSIAVIKLTIISTKNTKSIR